MAHYIEHYEAQLGGGGMENFYRGAAHQRGHGIGSFLGGLFRRVLPLLTRGAQAVGKEVLRNGANLLSDMRNHKPFKQAFKTRVKESGINLQQKAEEKVDALMKGSGYKKGTAGTERQLTLARLKRLVAGHPSTRANRKKKNKKKTTTKTRRGAADKSGRRPKKRAITDIFGPR